MSNQTAIPAVGKPTKQIYSDFLTDLNPHPIVKDIVKYTNENAVSKSIRNLMLTNRGERLYQPDIGTDINRMLFEPMSDGISELLSTYITNTINVYEPRAKVLNTKTVPDFDNNLYSVYITFMVINKQEPITVNISLRRVR
jgi:phage baseplate assembly protein W